MYGFNSAAGEGRGEREEGVGSINRRVRRVMSWVHVAEGVGSIPLSISQ